MPARFFVLDEGELRPVGALDTAEASEYLGGLMSPGTLANLRVKARNAGPRYVREGRSVAYRIEDLDEYLSSLTSDGR